MIISKFRREISRLKRFVSKISEGCLRKETGEAVQSILMMEGT